MSVTRLLARGVAGLVAVQNAVGLAQRTNLVARRNAATGARHRRLVGAAH
jgi:hypothetical protein